MMDRFMASIALFGLACFLGVLIWYVPHWDLGAVIFLTLALVVYDFFLAPVHRERDGG
jgi:uncharacterized membrane protein YccC